MFITDTSGAAGGRGAEPQRKLGGAAAPQASDAPAPNPELIERPRRRRFSAEYKLRILSEADACTRPGEIGALLRREGLYSSRLSQWRRQRDEGALGALERKRGPKGRDARDLRIAELQARTERLEAELAKARKVIEIQGNVLALSEEMLGSEGATQSTER
jgi:transposase-like protein